MVEEICGRVMASNKGASPSAIVDDSGHLRVLDPETHSHSRLVVESCTVFQSKLQHFQNVTLSRHLSLYVSFRMCISCVDKDRSENMSGMGNSLDIILLVSLFDTKIECNVSCGTC